VKRKYISLAAILLLVIAIPLTVFIVQKQQELRQRASESPLPNNPSAILGTADFHADNFETGNKDKWSASDINLGNTVAVIAQAAEEGTKGLQVKTVDKGDARLIKNLSSVSGSPIKEIYTRVKFKLIQGALSKNMQQLMQIEANGLRIFSFGIKQEVATNPRELVFQTGGLAFNNKTGIQLVSNQWYCIESHTLVNGTEGSTTIWVDNNEVKTITGNNGSFPIDKILLGTQGTDKAAEYYYDDFSADNYNRLGCGPISPDPGPLRSSFSPTGVLGDGVTQTTMKLSTNVPATCNYDTNPGKPYDQMASTISSVATTNHSVLLTGLIPQATYTYYIRCKDTSEKINTSDEKLTFSVPIDKTITKKLGLRASYNSVSIYASFDGDDNNTIQGKANNATFQYRKAGTSTWIQGMEMTPDRREFIRGSNIIEPNSHQNEYRASILMATPGTKYEVKVAFSDTDGVLKSTNPLYTVPVQDQCSIALGGNEQCRTVTTKTESFPETGEPRYVAPPDLLHPASSGDGTRDNPWRSVETATEELNKGYFTTLLFKPGVYHERVFVNANGSESSYITLRPETPPQNAQQIKDPAYASQKVVIDVAGITQDSINSLPERKELCGKGDSSSKACGFILAGNYIRISGFEIIHGKKAVKIGAYLDDNGEIQDIVVEKNYIHDQDADGEKGTIGIGDTFNGPNHVHDVTVQGNEIHTNKNSKTGSIIMVNAATDGGHVIRNNKLIAHNPGDGQHGNDCMNGAPNFNWYGGFGSDTDISNNYCEGATDEGIELDGFNMNIRVWGNTIRRSNLGFSITPVFVGPVYVFRNTYYDPQQFWVNSCIAVKSGVGGQGYVYFYHNTFYLSDLGQNKGSVLNCNGIQIPTQRIGVGTGYSDQTRVEITGGKPIGTGRDAKAIARIKNGVVDGIYVVDGGSGYTSPPTIKIIDPAGTGTGATASVHLRSGTSSGPAPNGDVPDAEHVKYRNNIIMAYDRAVNHYRGNTNTPDMDFDMLSVEDNRYEWTGGATGSYVQDTIFAVWLATNYLTFDSFKAGSGQEKNGINAKAQFVDPSIGDLRLKSGSPGINIGTPLIGFNDSTSYFTANGTPDMGACEFGASWTDQTPHCIGYADAGEFEQPTPTPTISITQSPTPSFTPSPTRTPTLTPTPLGATNTPTPTDSGVTTGLRFSLKLHGIGNGGDNANPNSPGNMTPLTQQRQLAISILDGTGTVIYNKNTNIDYRTTTGYFAGSTNVPLPSGPYIIKIKTPKYLQKTLPGIVTLVQNQLNDLPTVDLIAGDANNDNILNIFDYNMIRDCYSDLAPARDCTDPAKKLATDITDDGSVNQFDYNLFIRELSVRQGE
jgi:hypothetical protein